MSCLAKNFAIILYLLLSFTFHIQLARKSCWLYFQNISRIWLLALVTFFTATVVLVITISHLDHCISLFLPWGFLQSILKRAPRVIFKMLGHVTLVSHALGTLHFAQRKKAKVFMAYKILLNLPCAVLSSSFPKLAIQTCPPFYSSQLPRRAPASGSRYLICFLT